MTYEPPTCPKCHNEDEWNGTDCGVCKYDIRVPWSVDDDGTVVEKSLTYLTNGPVYGVRIDVNKHTYPHTSATFTTGEALKLAASIIEAVAEALKSNADEAEADRLSAEYYKNQ